MLLSVPRVVLSSQSTVVRVQRSSVGGGRRTVCRREFSSESDKSTLKEAFQKINAKLKAQGISEENYTVDKLRELTTKDPEVKGAFDRIAQISKAWTGRKDPVRVVVTGASGQIGYQLLFRLASGQMLGFNQPIILQCLELTPALKALEGVAMELQDCAFPLLRGIVQTDDANKAFEGADFALLVGAKPRTKGMERGDLLKENAKIFEAQGKALNNNANSWVKVIVVGNPANTNAMITSHFAPKIPASQITAMTRLDHNRGLGMIAEKTNSKVTDIKNFCIWGNHSATQYPDITHALIGGKPAKDLLQDAWVKDTFIPAVQQRGAAIINARGASSAASAANAALEHMRDWHFGTHGDWTSMGVCSDGSYGVDKGLWYSYPVVCSAGSYEIVGNVPIDKFSAEKMEATRKELVSEKEATGIFGAKK